MQNVPFRNWGDNSTEESRREKIAGVTDALELSSYVQSFRDRMLSRDAGVRKTALQEGGKFIALPKDLEVRCFQEKDPDRDNHIDLILPEFKPGGQTPPLPNAEELWLCTWFPYDPTQPRPRRKK